MADEQIISAPIVDKFKLGKKWFWAGIAVAFLNAIAGLAFGIVLLTEKGYRREGLIIIAFSIVWAYARFFFVGPWLIQMGLLPKFEVIIKK